MEGKTKHQRKKNFSTDEVKLLIEEYEANRNIFEGKFSNTLSNIQKNTAWLQVTNMINSLGVDNRTVEEVKNKWKNLCSSAKGSLHSFKKSSLKTGGGPPPKPPTESEEKIISLFDGRPSFEGINDGFVTSDFLFEGK